MTRDAGQPDVEAMDTTGRRPENGGRLVFGMAGMFSQSSKERVVRRASLDRRGFSLIEMLLVIALIVALAGILLPNFSGRRETEQLRSAARQLETLITLTRNNAMLTACRHQLAVSADGRRVVVEWEKDPLEQAGVFVAIKADWAEVNIGDLSTRCVRVELSGLLRGARQRERMAIEQTDDQERFESIEFLPDGRCDATLIVLQGPSGSRTALDLDGLTGLMKVTERWEPIEAVENTTGQRTLE